MNSTSPLRILVGPWAAIVIGLSACGGGDSDNPSPAPDTPAPAPEQPAPPPKFTYTPDPQVCAWMGTHVPPFTWPADRVGPRNWPAVAPVVTYAHPERNAQGVPLYTLTSNEWVLSEVYTPLGVALGVHHSPTWFWAQQVACDYGLTIEQASNARLSAYMTDEAAARIAREPYAGELKQTDLCAPGITFTGLPPRELPPECQAPPQ